MDNYSVPSDPPPPDGAAVPTGPAVTAIPDPDDLEALDNPPPPKPDVEETPGPPDMDMGYDDDLPALGPVEDAPEALAAPFLTFPMLSVALCAAAGVGAGIAAGLVVRTRVRTA